MRAGDLIESVAFDSLVGVADGSGGAVQQWQEQLVARAHFRYLRGGEAVVAARLSGRQPVVATIWAQGAALSITPEWRMRDTRRGTVYNIRTVVPTDDRLFIELTCERGVSV